MRLRGRSTIEIARRHGKAYATVDYALRQMGWAKMAVGAPRKYARGPLLRMVAEGYALRDIARRLGIPYASVWRIAQTVR